MVAGALAALSVALISSAYALDPKGVTVENAVQVVVLVPVVAVGLLLTLRRRRNAVGWVVSGIGLIVALQRLIAAVIARVDATGDPNAVYAALLWVDGKSFLFLWTAVIALFLLFPNGRLASTRWRWAAALAAGGLVVSIASFAFKPGPLREELAASATTNPPNPTALSPAAWDAIAFVEPIAFTMMVGALVASLASLVVRYRTADAATRTQIRWVMASALLFGFLLLVNTAVRDRAGTWLPLADALVGLAFSLVPVSIAVAILRYRLYEIDRLINRTVVYALLTAVLAGAYAVAVTAMRAVTSPVTGDSALAVAASTLVVAALFGPARSRIQGSVDRRFNRARYDATKTVERFSARLRDEVDLDTLKVELVTVVCATMEPARATLWLREAGR